MKRTTSMGRSVGTPLLLVAVCGAIAACGGEVRSESEVPQGGESVVDAGERPTLIEREDAVLSDLLHAPEAEARARRERERLRDPDEPSEPVAGPQPLPRYSTRAEPEVPEEPAPALRATDGPGQVVEAEPAELEAEVDDEVVEDPWVDTGLQPYAVPEGVELELAIESEISTERNQVGDVFYAVLVEDVLASDGLVLLPGGTRVRGVVTSSVASESADSLPVLEVHMDAILTEAGERPVSAVVVDADLLIEERDSGEESAVKVLTGAAAGAILGRVLGDDKKDAVKGGVAGAAAGAAVALGTRGGHARIEPGGIIVIRLERPLIVQ